MTAEQRRALQLKDEEFRALPAAERARLEELHAALRADDVAGGTLGDTMRRYLDLLGRLDDEQRARLRDATDPAARVGDCGGSRRKGPTPDGWTTIPSAAGGPPASASSPTRRSSRSPGTPTSRGTSANGPRRPTRPRRT